MTTVLKAYYDGAVFIPTIPVDVQTGKTLVMSILQEEPSAFPSSRIRTLEQITNNLREINVSEPLPTEFDQVISQRIHFKDINL
ncbi:MAG: hypothetical protein FWF09_00835 [Bacteroidales bacterium]|nr:hypothetical protein [Bacteroidales bacterium]